MFTKAAGRCLCLALLGCGPREPEPEPEPSKPNKERSSCSGQPVSAVWFEGPNADVDGYRDVMLRNLTPEVKSNLRSDYLRSDPLDLDSCVDFEPRGFSLPAVDVAGSYDAELELCDVDEAVDPLDAWCAEYIPCWDGPASPTLGEFLWSIGYSNPESTHMWEWTNTDSLFGAFLYEYDSGGRTWYTFGSINVYSVGVQTYLTFLEPLDGTMDDATLEAVVLGDGY
jgi:hypothetical protein